jgi:peptidoglycan/LPS O-acetylase OafA/YrhL
MNGEPRSLGRQPSLDGLRALAVLSVMGLHVGYSAGGNGGVTLFFALSGFLITALLLEEHDKRGHIGLKLFYLRRVLRLAPALCAMLAIDVIFVLLYKHGWELKAGLAGAAAALVYITNWLSAFRLLPLYQILHTWSLAVEEQFYLIWPALLILLLRFRVTRGRLAAIVFGGAVFFTLERTALALAGAHEMRLYTGLDTRSDALLLGAAAAFAYRYRLLGDRFWSGPGGHAIAVVSLAALATHLFGGVGAVPRSTSAASLASYSAVAVLTTALVLALVSTAQGPIHRLLSSQPLRYLGTISYGLYLYHYLLFSIVDAQAPTWSHGVDLTVKVLLTLAVSAASYRFIEQPFLRLKERIARPGASTAPVLSPADSLLGVGARVTS